MIRVPQRLSGSTGESSKESCSEGVGGKRGRLGGAAGRLDGGDGGVLRGARRALLHDRCDVLGWVGVMLHDRCDVLGWVGIMRFGPDVLCRRREGPRCDRSRPRRALRGGADGRDVLVAGYASSVPSVGASVASRACSRRACASRRSQACRRRQKQGRTPIRCRRDSRGRRGARRRGRRSTAAAQTPAAITTAPSLPGMWKSRRSARANISAITPAATRNTAASTNDTSPKALIECELIAPLLRSNDCRSYQGRNIVTSSASAATVAMRCSGASAPQARVMRVIRVCSWGRRAA